MQRRAKIMATLGPASRDEDTLRALLQAGVDVVRLNLSHGGHREHRETIRRMRRLAGDVGVHVPVLLDLMGPRYRLGDMPAPLHLAEGTTIRLGPEGSDADVPISRSVVAHLDARERFLIDGGLVSLEVMDKRGGAVRARVVSGGTVSSRKGINLPDSRIPFEISEKDRADIRFAVEEEADYLGASYVGTPDDVEAIREEMDRSGARLPLVAKLERSAAVEHLEEIVHAAEALMVARGDLGVEVPLHRVPVLQKRIIDACRRAGKPVVVATQMLESMVDQPRPSRAEATDVATAVLDGADSLMLSTETAAGKHPVAAVATMARIISEAESYAAEAAREPTWSRRAADLGRLTAEGAPSIPDVIAASGVLAARNLDVRWIVAFSQGGITARLVARHRPAAGILVFSPSARVARRLQLMWGVTPMLLDEDLQHHDQVVEVVERELLQRGLAAPGEAIAILMGDPIRERPPTNLLRLARLGGQRG